ncbi:MAG: YidC/Oxa1 family membrane protein insertase [Clostridia bacterium]|nr:YidC/Oxa1 family membrane protein insertase [Clostridia bacterium]
MRDWFFLTNWAFLGMRLLYQGMENLFSRGSLAVVITVLLSTLIIKSLTLFSDIKSRKSTMKMQQVQPELDKIKKKYENNPQKMNAEQRKLMKERGVSMMGGCLPMLFTLPLFFIFISAFRSWSNEQALRLVVAAENDSQNGTNTAVEMVESYRFLWIRNIWRPDNPLSAQPEMSGEQFYSTFSENIEKYYYLEEDDGKLREVLEDWQFFDDEEEFIRIYDEKMAPVEAVNHGYTNGFGILAVIAAATTFLSSWIMQRGQKNQQQAEGAKAPNKFMMYLFPAMTLFFCWQYDATFSLYWIFSNMISLCINLTLNAWFKKQAANKVEVLNR